MNLSHLSDDELVSRINTLCLEGHRLTARLIVHLIEVEERRLHLRDGYSSLFKFCVDRLGMTDNEAFRRINAARLVRRFPQLLAHIERGDICISTLERARHLIDVSTVDSFIAELAGKTQREVRAFLARTAPQPDAPDRVVELGPRDAQVPLAVGNDRDTASTTPLRSGPPATPCLTPAHNVAAPSENRFKIELTLGADAKQKLDRAGDLMRHRNPKGDLATVFEAALDELIAKLERERLGKVKRPRATRETNDSTKTTKNDGQISRAVRREVFERDGERCTFVSASGRQCDCTSLLELDHIVPHALGGSDDADNLRVRCRPHNRLYAEQTYGPERVAMEIGRARRRREGRTAEDGSEHLGRPKYFAGPTSEAVEESKTLRDDDPGCDRDGEAPAAPDVSETTRSALLHLGFRKPEAQTALDTIAARHGGTRRGIGLEAMIREALAILTG